MLTWAVVTYWRESMRLVEIAIAQNKSAHFNSGLDQKLMILAGIVGDVLITYFVTSMLGEMWG